MLNFYDLFQGGTHSSDVIMARKSYVAKAPIRRLMKREGADLVAQDALDYLIDRIEEMGKSITKTAVKLVLDDDRKRVTAEDIKKAAPQFVKEWEPGSVFEGA